MGPLGGILAKISPEAGVAASSIAGLTGGLEGLAGAGLAVGPALAIVAAIAGVLTMAYQGLTATSEHLAELQRITTEGTKGVAEATAKTARVMQETKLIEEGLTAAQRTQILSLYDTGIALDKATKSSRDLVEANRRLLEFKGIPSSWSEATGVLSRAMGDLGVAIDSIDGGLDSLASKAGVNAGVLSFLTTFIRGVTTSTEELTEESAAATAAMVEQDTTSLHAAIATAKKTEADLKAAEAERKRTAAKRDGEVARAKELADEKALLKSTQALIDKTTEAGWTEREEIGETAKKVDADFEHRLGQYDKESQIYKDLQDGRVEARRQSQQALMDFDDAEVAAAEAKAEELAKIEKEAAEKKEKSEKDERNAELSAASSSASSLSGLWQQLNDQKLAGIDKTSKEGRKAAKKQWQENKAAAMAMATVQSALAVAMALASAPPPLNVPAVISATVAGAAAVASIAAAPSPKFHAGTGEVRATLADREAVLTAPAADRFGRENIARANSGRDPLPQWQASSPLVIQYRHQVFNRFIRDNLKTTGPLAVAVRDSRPTGFRDRG